MSSKKQWPESDLRSLLNHIYILCLAPGLIALWLSFSARDEGHTFSMEILVHYLAASCLFMLTVTLAITPLARMLGQPNLGVIRRPFGLASFGYAFAHWMAIFFLYEFNGTAIWFAFAMNPSLWAALLALLLLVPMALTATHQSMHDLGVWWRRIHSAIYVVSLLWVFYMIKSFKVTLGDQILFCLVCLLLLSRVYHYYNMQSKKAQIYDLLDSKNKDKNQDKDEDKK